MSTRDPYSGAHPDALDERNQHQRHPLGSVASRSVEGRPPGRLFYSLQPPDTRSVDRSHRASVHQTNSNLRRLHSSESSGCSSSDSHYARARELPSTSPDGKGRWAVRRVRSQHESAATLFKHVRSRRTVPTRISKGETRGPCTRIDVMFPARYGEPLDARLRRRANQFRSRIQS